MGEDGALTSLIVSQAEYLGCFSVTLKTLRINLFFIVHCIVPVEISRNHRSIFKRNNSDDFKLIQTTYTDLLMQFYFQLID